MITSAAIDLMVIGTHGYEGVKKLVLGSVAEAISPCHVSSVDRWSARVRPFKIRN